LRLKRIAQLSLGDPPLFEHHQPKWNAMPMRLVRQGAAIEFAAKRPLHAGLGAFWRTGPASFKYWGGAFAKEMQPARATIGIRTLADEAGAKESISIRLRIGFRPGRGMSFLR
jgi:hypothetical protein